MRILFVLEHFHPYVGGAEELFLKLTTALVNEGYDVSVVCTRHDSSVAQYEDHQGVKIHRVNCYNRFLFTLFSLPIVLKLARRSDLIHTTSYNSAVPAFIGGLFARKKVVITFHEVWGKLWMKLPFTPKWLLKAYSLFESLILKLPFYKYIAVSKSTKRALEQSGVPSRKIEQIYNGLDYTVMKAHPHRPPTDFTYCFYGRLGISKGIDLLLEASRDFLKQHPQARLKLIIPTYPESVYTQVLDLIRKWNIEEKVVLLHNLPWVDLLKEVSTSSCVVIPSHSEGFCFVAAESSAMQVPVISSGKGSLPEVVSGKYVLMNDQSAESINTSLELAIREQWMYMPVVHFSLTESVKCYMDLYKTLK